MRNYNELFVFINAQAVFNVFSKLYYSFTNKLKNMIKIWTIIELLSGANIMCDAFWMNFVIKCRHGIRASSCNYLLGASVCETC